MEQARRYSDRSPVTRTHQPTEEGKETTRHLGQQPSFPLFSPLSWLSVRQLPRPSAARRTYVSSRARCAHLTCVQDLVKAVKLQRRPSAAPQRDGGLITATATTAATTATDTSGKLSPLPPLRKFKTLAAVPSPQRAPVIQDAGFFIPSPKSLFHNNDNNNNKTTSILMLCRGLW